MIKLLCLILIIEYAYLVEVEEVYSEDSKYNNVDYLNFFKVPFSMIQPKTNLPLSEENDLSKAFDGRENTFWKSKIQQDNPFLIS